MDSSSPHSAGCCKMKREKEGVGMSGEAPFQINEDDYYKRSPEFREWLLTRHQVYFDTLDGKKARKYFRKFVEKWNGNRVDPKIYAMATKSSSRKIRYQGSHHWNIAGTEDVNPGEQGAAEKKVPEKRGKESRYDASLSTGRPSKHEIKEWRKRQREDLDEIAPKPEPGSFAARMDKRRSKHGRHDDSPDVDEFKFNSNHSDVKEVIAKRRAHREKKQEQRRAAAEERIHELEEKERKRMTALKEKLGLTDRFTGGGSEFS